MRPRQDTQVGVGNGVGFSSAQAGVGIFRNYHALYFDGIDERLVSASYGGIPDGQSFSVSLWVKSLQLVNTMRIISNVTGGAGFECYYLHGGGGSSSRYRFTLKTSGGAVNLNIEPTFNAWNHVVATFNASTLTANYYKNSVLIDTKPIPNSVWNPSTQLQIGRDNVSGTNYFNGSVDEVSIFNKELTQPEVTQLYNSGKAQDLKLLPFYSNIRNWWRLGDGGNYPTTVQDVTGSKDLAVVNMDLANLTPGVPTE